jgi:hypothetical protein
MNGGLNAGQLLLAARGGDRPKGVTIMKVQLRCFSPRAGETAGLSKHSYGCRLTGSSVLPGGWLMTGISAKT